MEPARTERASKPDVDKGRAGKIVRRKDKVENVAGVARAQAAAGVADKAKVAVVVGADKTVNATQADVILLAAN
ncbi:hypothetical protein DESC_720213 [Desulfosarcina cetonica]|nr:hypothetical protein DESC_720213 [Desulfosarcina cetonica]